MAGSKPLPREREVELAARTKQGDLEARNELVSANLRFVIGMATHYQHWGLPLAELISAGNVGLMTAADRFDGTKGYKFITYAVWWIRQSIQKTLAEHVRTVRLPVNRLALVKNISTVSRRLEQERGEEPKVDEIAAELDLPARDILDAQLSAGATCSLDKELGEDDKDFNLRDVLADSDQESPDADVLRASATEQLETVIDRLDAREQRILRLYFGLDGDLAQTLEEIGSLFGLTRERIRQVKERALVRLRDRTLP